MLGTSFGECSISSRIQSNPLWAMISATILLHRLLHNPIWTCPALRAALNAFRGRSTVDHPCGGLSESRIPENSAVAGRPSLMRGGQYVNQRISDSSPGALQQL